MKYDSTRGGVSGLGFIDAVLTGLADDGGLMVPQHVPTVGPSELARWKDMSYQELSYSVMRKFIDIEEIPCSDLKRMISKAYSTFSHSDICPTVDKGSFCVLELFHGPTFAFKDVALQFLGCLFEYSLAARNRRMAILGATSGDTGSAAIAGVRGKPNIDCFILYPRGRTSRIQELQMVTVPDDNIHCLAVEGTFDDCQDIVKSIFTSEAKQELQLGAVNSINWARILAQIVYYFFSAFQTCKLKKCDSVVFSVPTGNFGDILAGYYAKLMGAPISQLIVASNSNDILPRFFRTGVYQKNGVVPTMSPSMDIEVSSNFERFLFDVFKRSGIRTRSVFDSLKSSGSFSISSQELAECQKFFAAYSVNEDETLKTIQAVHSEHNYFLCPHSAVGWKSAESFRAEHRSSGPIVVLATAHIGKFTEQVESKLGSRDSIFKSALDQCVPTQLSQLRTLKERKTNVPASDMAVLNQLRSRVRSRSMLTTMIVLAASVAVLSLCAKYFARSS